jgi:hypothetical protein
MSDFGRDWSELGARAAAALTEEHYAPELAISQRANHALWRAQVRTIPAPFRPILSGANAGRNPALAPTANPPMNVARR